MIVISRHSGGLSRSSRCTNLFRDLDLARQEEFALQVDVANLYQNNLARRPITGREHIQWENLPAATGANGLCAPDISANPNILRPTTTIRLALFLAQPTVVTGRHITLLVLGKDAFGVEIETIYRWWATWCNRYEFTLVIAHNQSV